jgi:hypothetical protein
METIDAMLPVYTVQGANWTIDILLDEDDAEMSEEDQMMEAATKACEIFKAVLSPEYASQISNDSFRITDESNAPYMGVVLFVHPKDTDPDKTQKLIKSSIVLANGGFYNDSLESEKVLEIEMRELKKETDKKNDKDVENFAKLQKDVKAGKLGRRKRK